MIKLLILFFSISAAYSQDLLSSFHLRRINSENEELFKDIVIKDLAVVIAYGKDCPILRKQVPVINALNSKYSESISFILINAVKSLNDEILDEERTSFSLVPFIYQDSGFSLLKALHFTTLSEVALVRISTNEILYQGGISDQFTFDLTRTSAKKNYLKDAILSALHNKRIKTSRAPVYGCTIGY
jgi:thiol-disulfide isomerase/thioredoxin